MRNSMLLIHPQVRETSNDKNSNIFEHARYSESLPSIKKSLIESRQARLYDFVGSTQFKRKKFFPESMRSTDGATHKSRQTHQQIKKKDQECLNQTLKNFSKVANSTINRQTILSKLTMHEQLQASKERRNIDKYQEYQNYWQKQANQMKKLINKKRPSIVETNQGVVVLENKNKIDIINNHIVHFWEMSLRNHDPTLLRHLQGHRYGQVELEQKLQLNQGLKQVEGSIPKLPLQALKKVKRRQLSLTGRSKSNLQSQVLTERSSIPFSHRDILNQEQVYKISYAGDKKYMGVQGF